MRRWPPRWPPRPARLLLAVREEVGFYDPYDLGDAGDRRANTLILDRLRTRPARRRGAVARRPPTTCPGSTPTGCGSSTRSTAPGSSRLPGRDDWAVHIALWQRTGGPHGGGITDAAVALPALRRGVPHRHRHRAAAAHGAAPSASRPAPAGRRRCCGGCATSSTSSWCGSGRPGAKAMAVVRGDVDAYIHAGGQWEWDSAARPAWCGPQACTRRGWTARR